MIRVSAVIPRTLRGRTATSDLSDASYITVGIARSRDWALNQCEYLTGLVELWQQNAVELIDLQQLSETIMKYCRHIMCEYISLTCCRMKIELGLTSILDGTERGRVRMLFNNTF